MNTVAMARKAAKPITSVNVVSSTPPASAGSIPRGHQRQLNQRAADCAVGQIDPGGDAENQTKRDVSEPGDGDGIDYDRPEQAVEQRYAEFLVQELAGPT